MSRIKIIILIIFLIFLLILIIALRQQGEKGSNTSPVQKSDQTQTITPFMPQKFTIVGSNLTNSPIAVSDEIKILFSQPVDNETLSLELTPEASFLPLFNQNLTELTLKPSDTWNFDTSYSFKILKQTKSKAGQSLDKDYHFFFKTPPYSGI